MSELSRAPRKVAGVAVAGTAVTLVGGSLAVAVPTAHATDYPVSTFAGLSQAITDANGNPGPDTITIAAGAIMLTGNLPAITDELTITGYSMATTILDGNDKYRVFYAVSSASALTVSDLTIVDAYFGNNGAGIYANAIDLTIDSVTISASTSSGHGAVGWHAYDATDELTISGCTFSGNTSTSGGTGAVGVYVKGGTVSITDSTFYDNSSVYGAGGLSLRGSGGTATITNVTFDSNYGHGDGGALSATGSYLDLVIDGSTFTDNESLYDGGAVKVEEIGDFAISGSTFNDNTARNGGALYQNLVRFSVATISDSTFTGNTARGSLADSSQLGEGGAVWANSNILVADSTISHNQATGSGGAFVQDFQYLTIENSTLTNNYSARDGGAVAAKSGTRAYIHQSTLYHNGAKYHGGAVFVAYQAAVSISNSTISDNFALNGGGGVATQYSGSSALTIDNSILANNASGVGADEDDLRSVVDVSGDNNLIEATAATLTGTGNLTGEDPLLDVLADNGGTTETMLLLDGSPAIDAGNDLVAPFDTDQRGETRIQGEAIDIGAVEWVPPTAEPTDPTEPTGPTPPVLPATGSGTGSVAWWAVLLSGLGAAVTFGATRRRRPS